MLTDDILCDVAGTCRESAHVSLKAHKAMPVEFPDESDFRSLQSACKLVNRVLESIKSPSHLVAVPAPGFDL